MINPTQAYMKNQVNTASPEQLVLLLYNGALRFIRQARMGMEKKQIEQSHRAIIKAQDILQELMGNLDFSQGEIAQSLYALYDYIYRCLLEANIKKSTSPLDAAEKMLTELRDTWAEACRLS
jgi:flagellar protein FliS